ncbi:hypothetical protein LJ737_09660 [Hymenobacter sp. 15J16-1T3B]|uniref:hypothetical protein n=1 Tax=Hymenobacter sp. 15J16-1T3B TaxID=2886941 RepID=UPI001D12BE66|nr:hypothetical protein [Hymenobacter sp. 15J16-1T3B]MCC3157505.1 hypothetical protein [Hymenobacter sp. 15J16-1T3B]
MQQLFDDIVRVFVATCRATGLSYPELNILVYCLLTPLSWLLVLALRRPRLGGPLVLGAALLVGALTMARRRFAPLSRWFYDYNIRVLELAGRYTGLGYVKVSLLVGVVVPAVALLLLLLVPRRAVLPLAAAFAVLLLLYFVVGWFAL